MNPSMEVRILEGASTLFYKFGFTRVRFSEIAKEIGITTRTIYNYYPNKQSLAKAVSEYTIRKIMDEMDVLMKSELSFSELIQKILVKVYEELSTKLPAYRSDSFLPWKKGQAGITIDPAIEELIGKLIQKGMMEGVLKQDAPIPMMMQILLNQVNYCFPSDGGNRPDHIDEDYFVNSMMLILQSCLSA